MSSEIDQPSSTSSDASDVENAVLESPLYYVLAQFLETVEGNNVAQCLHDLTDEVRKLRETLARFVPQDHRRAT
jgi:glycosylphosphatidylinositol transamidase (GPIT) subunit GPI8